MTDFNRIKTNPNICGVEVAFSSNILPSHIPNWQQFYNSVFSNNTFVAIYASSGSVSFDEESDETISGPLYKQKIVIRFPSNDKNRSERLAELNKVKFIKLKLTNGSDLVIGRNDIIQNSRPKIKTKSNHQLTEVSFETVSIFPSGFAPNNSLIGFPALIPILIY